MARARALRQARAGGLSQSTSALGPTGYSIVNGGGSGGGGGGGGSSSVSGGGGSSGMGSRRQRLVRSGEPEYMPRGRGSKHAFARSVVDHATSHYPTVGLRTGSSHPGGK